MVTSISALFAFHEEKPDVPVDNKVLAQLQEWKNPLTLLSAYEPPTQVAEGFSNQPEAMLNLKPNVVPGFLDSCLARYLEKW